MAGRHLEGLAEEARHHLIVGRTGVDVVASCEPHPAVYACRDPAILPVAEQLDAGLAASELADDLDAVIRRGIINDDDLQRPDALPEDAVKRLGEKPGMVVVGYHDRESWQRHPHSFGRKARRSYEGGVSLST